MLRRLALAVVAAIGLVWASAAPASAHTALAGADPAPGSVQVRQPSTVVLRFEKPVNRAGSRAWIADRDGSHRRELALGSISAATLQAGVSPLEPGVYRLGFDVAGSDGHRYAGEYRFAVWPSGTPAPAGIEGLATTTITNVNRPLAAARGLALAGSLPLAGLAVAAYTMRRRPAPRWFQAILLSVGGAVVVADLVVIAWNGSPLQAVQTRFGGLLAAHAAAAAVLIGLGRRSAFRLAAVVAGVMLLPLALTGHAYALSTQRALATAMDWGHLASASAWVGGLTWLIICLAAQDRVRLAEDARELARWAPAAATIVVVTGTFNAWSRVPAWRVLVGSDYGRVLVIKVGLVAGALAFARAARRGRWRALSGEGAVMTGVLIAAATLAALTPPMNARLRPAGPVLANAVLADQMYAVLVTPGIPGENTVRVTPIKPKDAEGGGAPTLEVVVDGAGAVDLALDPASSGWTATFDLTRKPTRLRVGAGSVSQEVVISSARAPSELRMEARATLGGPNGGECRSRLIGQMAALEDFNATRRDSAALVASDARADCEPPQSALDPEAVGRIFGRFLADYMVTSAAVVGDLTPRTSEFLAGLKTTTPGTATRLFDRSELGEARSWAPEAVVVAGGRDAGADLVAATADGAWVPPRGLFFAPWLLDAGLLTSAVEGRGAQVTVGLDFDPYQLSAQRYLAALSREFPFETPTAAGFGGYVDATDAIEAAASGRTSAASPPPAMRFFAAAQVAFLPAALHGEHGRHSWLGAGGLAEVGGTIPDPKR